MRAAAERVEATGPAVVAGALAFCALFFGNGLSPAPLVWIGGLALVLAAVPLLWLRAPGRDAGVLLGCLGGLALWCGLSIVWSASPDRSWIFTNRTLAYLGFAALGVAVGTSLPRALERVAAAAATLVALVLGWALLAKCVPALYSDYGRLARLRAPLDDWNMLALVCVVGVVLALWLGSRSRVGGVLLLYLSAVALLLTYSRFGVALACLAAAAWVALEPDRVESLAALALGGGVAAGVFAVALGLDGITSDGQTRAVRVHDGWVFALVVLAGAALVAAVAVALLRLPPLVPERRRTVERAAAAAALVVALAGLGVTVAKANRIWTEFTNPVAGQVPNTKVHLTKLGSGNRWTWWQEAWDGFTAHPGGGTGAGTFQFTDLRLRRSSDVTALEPHNTPLQFLSETGIVGFLLFLGAAAAALAGAWRRRGGAGTALGVAVAAFFAHSVVNYDWSFVAVCGPLLLLAGVVAAEPAGPAPARRPLLAAAAVVFALGCVYSLAAPWLAQRVPAASVADLKRAHSYDPLSTDVLTAWAAFEDALGSPQRAEKLYGDALALEPTNASVWYSLASFYAERGAWHSAYRALSRSYRYDPYGLAGQCGLAAEIRRRAGVAGATCRGAGSPASP